MRVMPGCAQLEYTSAWLEDPVVELASLREAIEEIQAYPLRTLRRSNAAVGELATTLDSQSLIYWVEKVRAPTLPQLPVDKSLAR
jgi:hypothetical protein